MAKQPKMRWSDSDTEKLERLAAQFNNKADQLRRALPESVDYLPPNVSVDQIKNTTTNRTDFNKQIRYLESFVDTSFKPALNKQGILTSAWYIDQLNKMNATTNRRINRMRKEMEEADVLVNNQGERRKGWEVDTRSGMDLNPRSFNFANMKKSDFARKAATITRQYYDAYWEQRAENYKDVYIQSLYLNLPNYASQIEDIIRKIPSKAIWYNYAKYNEFLKIGYSHEPQDEMLKAHQIIAHWNAVLGTGWNASDSESP